VRSDDKPGEEEIAISKTPVGDETRETNVRKLVQVLQSTVERVIRTLGDPEPSSEVPLGLYIVRGDNVCTVGVVDEALDESINWAEVKGAVIGGIKHS
jgi:hypothetical protein